MFTGCCCATECDNATTGGCRAGTSQPTITVTITGIVAHAAPGGCSSTQCSELNGTFIVSKFGTPINCVYSTGELHFSSPLSGRCGCFGMLIFLTGPANTTLRIEHGTNAYNGVTCFSPVDRITAIHDYGAAPQDCSVLPPATPTITFTDSAADFCDLSAAVITVTFP